MSLARSLRLFRLFVGLGGSLAEALLGGEKGLGSVVSGGEVEGGRKRGLDTGTR